MSDDGSAAAESVSCAEIYQTQVRIFEAACQLTRDGGM